jgi:hypothetical protein
VKEERIFFFEKKKQKTFAHWPGQHLVARIMMRVLAAPRNGFPA